MKEQVLCLLPLSEEQKNKLAQTAQNRCDFTYTKQGTETLEQVQRATIIMGSPKVELIKQASQLRWLQLNSSGADKYTPQGILPSGCQLTNATGAYGKSVGEHTFAVLMTLLKKLYLYRDNQNNLLWQDEGVVRTLSDMHILIVGYGDIGSWIAKLCRPFAKRITGVKHHASDCPTELDALYTDSALHDLIPQADCIISILPGTTQTHELWNKTTFGLMKPSAYFINVGRGDTVNQDDLYDVLRDNKIAAASLDVTTPEPLPPDSPLWKLKNLVLTPHIAGTYHLYTTLDIIFAIAEKNLGLFLDGKELTNQVDFTTGYRKVQ